MSNLKPVDQLKKTLVSMKEQFSTALPKHISPAKFVRVLQTAVSTNPGLVTANRDSLLASCMRLAEKGLNADGNEAALVLFGDKVTPMVMLGGVLKLARNSGEIKSITSQTVYKNDIFEYWIDVDGEHINHRPSFFSDRGEMIGVYALAQTKDNGIYIEVLTMSDIEKIKKSSRSANSGPWQSWFEQMAKKSALRRLCKRLPSSTDLDQALSDDDEREFVNDQPAQQAVSDEPIDVSPAPEEQKKSKMEKIVEASEVPI